VRVVPDVDPSNFALCQQAPLSVAVTEEPRCTKSADTLGSGDEQYSGGAYVIVPAHLPVSPSGGGVGVAVAVGLDVGTGDRAGSGPVRVSDPEHRRATIATTDASPPSRNREILMVHLPVSASARR